MNIEPRWIAPVAVALALAAPLAAMGDNGHAGLATGPVTVIAAGEATSFDGVVEAVRQTVLASQVAGSVVALDVRAGDRVKAGQVLVRLDARAAEQQAGAAAAQVQAARAAQEAAKREFDRQRSCSRRTTSARLRSTAPRRSSRPRRRRPRRSSRPAGAARTQSGFYVDQGAVRRHRRRRGGGRSATWRCPAARC